VPAAGMSWHSGVIPGKSVTKEKDTIAVTCAFGGDGVRVRAKFCAAPSVKTGEVVSLRSVT